VKVPLSWLAELLPALPDADTVVARLDALGLAVDGLEVREGAPADVVVAEVSAVRPVEGSDHLVVATVDDGSGGYEVVSGAPNTAPGLRTALARPGARLPGLDAVVAVREVMGERSEGMLCSPRELGLFDHAGGLLVLGDDAPLGAALTELWPGDTVLELELTPNRADAFSILGVARDLAADLGCALAHPAEAKRGALGDPTVDDGLRLEVEDPARCARLVLRRVDDVRVGPSPVWLQRRLASLGLRPRNNVVDVTNYVTFELGQPSHAYDLRALQGGILQVRRARAGESLVTLNDDALELDPEDLVIAVPDERAGSRAVGLAGVIGGRDDSVRSDTRSLALEVAHFAPVGVRRTARRHRLVTDAHYRFERGVDPNLPPLAAARAAALIAEVSGGRVHDGVSAFGADVERPVIAFRPARVAFLTALEVPLDEQRAALERLGCAVQAVEPDAWRVTPPSWRFDLGIEEDLIEEVARLHGFDRIGSTVPAMDFVPPSDDPTHRRLRDALVGAGLLETISYAFTGEAELAAARASPPTVRLAEPQGTERAVMRTALYPGLLSAARLNHAAPDLALFEVGRVFGDEERERLALLLRGERLGATWRAAVPVDFFVLKGVLEQLAEGLGQTLEVVPAPFPHLHPGIGGAVTWGGRVVGSMGRVHPEVEAAFELGETFVAELDLPLPARAPALAPVPRQPYAERDLAVVVPAALTYAELARVCTDAAGDLLVSLTPFDVYVGHPVAADHKSVAMRFRFRHAARALTDAEVDARMKEVISALASQGYTIRA
jgi:phenylalanyl-tRNA synthetase beta chain